MDTSYFGFKNTPFQSGLNPRYFYSTAAHEATHAAIARGLESRCGLIMVSGPAGIGKSALLLAKMAELGRVTHCLFFSGAELRLEDALDEICLELTGLTLLRQNTTEQTQMIKDCLAQPSNQQKTISLIIDNAEGLAESVLDGLLSLEDSPAGARIIQVILLGLPFIINRFRPASGAQELVPVHCQITPLSDYDIDPFIKHQLKAAGHDNNCPLFLPSAVEAIAAYTNGLPAAINILCNETLTLAPKHRTKTLTKEIVDEAWTLCAEKIKQTTAERGPPQPSLSSEPLPQRVQPDTSSTVSKGEITLNIPPHKAKIAPEPPAISYPKPHIAPLREQAMQITDDQCLSLKTKLNRSRRLLLVGALTFIAVLAGEGFMVLNDEPGFVFQARKLQLLPQQSIAIAQQTDQSNPSIAPIIVGPEQSFINPVSPESGLLPGANFVEITDSMNPTDTSPEFSNSGESELYPMEEPEIPIRDVDSPFIELK